MEFHHQPDAEWTFFWLGPPCLKSLEVILNLGNIGVRRAIILGLKEDELAKFRAGSLDTT